MGLTTSSNGDNVSPSKTLEKNSAAFDEKVVSARRTRSMSIDKATTAMKRSLSMRVEPEPVQSSRRRAFTEHDVFAGLVKRKSLTKADSFFSTFTNNNHSSKTLMERMSSMISEDAFGRDILSVSLWDGQALCVEYEGIRRCFLTYVQDGAWLEFLSPQIMEILSNKLSMKEMQDYILFSDYVIAPRQQTKSNTASRREEVSSTMKRCTSLKVKESMANPGGSFRDDEIIQSSLPDNGMQCLLLAIVWPFFRSSAPFLQAAQEVNLVLPFEEGEAMEPKSHSSAPMKAIDAGKMRRVHMLLRQTVESLNLDEMTSLLSNGQWLCQLSTAIDSAPFSLSIANGDEDEKGFPLMFVNRAFEELTQYPRCEALNRNCNFLKCPNTDENISARIALSLSQGMGIKASVTNARRDGSEFQNFLAIRSVHNRRDNNRYVIGVQYNMQRGDASYHHLRLIEDLMVLLSLLLKS
jgi:PAS domain S-box-containing protein